MNRSTFQAFAVTGLISIFVADQAIAQNANATSATVEVFAPSPQIPLDDAFPGGISPSHVYAKLDRLDRSLDRMITARNIPLPTYPQELESGLQPMHVYQAVLACADRLQQFDGQIGAIAMPTVAARPAAYGPRDVLLVVALMLDNVRQAAKSLEIDALPDDEPVVSEKTPTDVFARAVRVLIKLNALCGLNELRPAQVYVQMVRAIEDVKSILRQNDPACRYRIDAPRSEIERKPSDVLYKCLEIRRLINGHRERLGMRPVPVPEHPGLATRPRDVFLQSQIIIAELNLLKMQLNTVSATPLPLPADQDTTATDVYSQATMLEYLLLQVGQLDSESLTELNASQRAN